MTTDSMSASVIVALMRVKVHVRLDHFVGAVADDVIGAAQWLSVRSSLAFLLR